MRDVTTALQLAQKLWPRLPKDDDTQQTYHELLTVLVDIDARTGRRDHTVRRKGK
jgi:hypothetical protein